jgi:hypothetical protein
VWTGLACRHCRRRGRSQGWCRARSARGRRANLAVDVLPKRFGLELRRVRRRAVDLEEASPASSRARSVPGPGVHALVSGASNASASRWFDLGKKYCTALPLTNITAR